MSQWQELADDAGGGQAERCVVVAADDHVAADEVLRLLLRDEVSPKPKSAVSFGSAGSVGVWTCVGAPAVAAATVGALAPSNRVVWAIA